MHARRAIPAVSTRWREGVMLAAACWLLVTPPLAARAEAPSPELLAAALAAADRPEADRARDAGRRPAEVIAFLGITPGMRVIDLVAAGGYYTEVLSAVVGPGGRVYAHNTPFVLQMRDGEYDQAMASRLAGGRLPNVERVDRDLSEAPLSEGSLQAAFTALNFHDVYNGRGPEAARAFLARVFSLLEPGGVLGLVDHSGDATQDNQALHRVEEQLAIEAARAAGFVLEATSDVLRNPSDDRSANVFDPAIRGRTDRFVLRLRKPVASP